MAVTEITDRSPLASGLGRRLSRVWLTQGWLPRGARRPVRMVLFPGVWLLYLIQPLATLAHNHHSAGALAAAIATTVVFCAIYFTVIICWDSRPALARLGRWLLFPLAGALTLMFPGSAAGGHVVWIYVSVIAGWGASNRREMTRALLTVSACYLFFSWLGHDNWSDTLITLIPVVFVGLMMSGFRTQLKLMRELSKAREEVARLAASEERLRLARDMHDLTGQSLSMITLKSELAARLLERLPEGPDRHRVADEIQQVAAVSRQTLHDIREAISGYRRPTLAVEIITARSALESAGIAPSDDPALTLLSGTFGPDAEAALAWCLREAVTNVIRHSGARNCSITLTRHDLDGALSLEVRDDGRGLTADDADAADASDRQPVLAGSMPRSPGAGAAAGSGLHGMSERLSAVGGHLELRPAAPGFCLIATVPAGEDAPGAAGAAGAAGDAAGAAREGAAAGVTVTR